MNYKLSSRRISLMAVCTALVGAVAFLDLSTLAIKSVFEIILTLGVLAAVRRALGRDYLL